ncbi:MAG: hypothetical protein ABSG69_04870 [Candidatus Acidiferrum sp.]|jgi:hypothetical protein
MTQLDMRNSLKPVTHAALGIAAVLLFIPLSGRAQAASGGDRWLHVRVVSADGKGESVCVNVPLELAEKVLPAINKEQLHGGKVTIDKFDGEDVDFRAVLDAVRTSKDGEFVTVNGKDGEDVRVAKQGGFLVVHVTDNSGHLQRHHHLNKDGDEKKSDDTAASKASATPSVSHVEVRIPLSVVDALLSAGKDQLDLVAGLKALSAQGDTELVSVKDEENSVRVWVDSKNTNGTEGATR